jgi:calcineurin-like phosphoesterase family protein
VKTFLISDTHFGHNNAYKFKRADGTPLRPWANDAFDGDEWMIERWNSVVGEYDRVYHLGDVAIPRKGLKVLSRLNGRKILVKGNHDIYKKNDYLPYFDDIRGSHKLGNFILSHIPIHPDCLARWTAGNIHGHLHSNKVMKKNWYGKLVEDKRYFNVGVELLDGYPINFEDIVEKMR